jgi:hypothetical protein
MTAATLATRVATRDVCSWSTANSTLLLLLLAVALIIVTGYSISSWKWNSSGGVTIEVVCHIILTSETMERNLEVRNVDIIFEWSPLHEDKNRTQIRLVRLLRNLKLG